MPDVRVRAGGAHRFLPSGTGLVYLPSMESQDFWLLDLATGQTSQLTRLADRGYLNGFDITPDGKSPRVRPYATERRRRLDRAAEEVAT